MEITTVIFTAMSILIGSELYKLHDTNKPLPVYITDLDREKLQEIIRDSKYKRIKYINDAAKKEYKKAIYAEMTRLSDLLDNIDK